MNLKPSIEYASKEEIKSFQETKLRELLTYLKENSETERILTSSEPGNYMDYYQQIYEHIFFGGELPSPGEEIIQNMEIIEAALESSREGKITHFFTT